MSDLPLVTCIMPTRNRTRFLAKAIDCFLAQDYPNKQLLIFEEEGKSLDAWMSHSRDERIVFRYWKERVFSSIGHKRNAMCSTADGVLIAHWDDDDWHSPRRLSKQIEKMIDEKSRLCGTNRLIFYNGERAYLFNTVRKPWLAGGTLIYERSLWNEQPFQEVSNGEDTAFVDTAYKRNVKITTIEDPSIYVAMLHESNTTKRNIDAQWGWFDVDQVRKWIGEKCAA